MKKCNTGGAVLRAERAVQSHPALLQGLSFKFFIPSEVVVREADDNAVEGSLAAQRPPGLWSSWLITEHGESRLPAGSFDCAVCFASRTSRSAQD